MITALHASALTLLVAALLPGCSPAPADKPAAGENAPVARAVASPVASNGVENAVEETEAPEAAADTPLAALHAPEDLPASNAAGDPQPFPAAVTAFMVDRDGCDHFRGEEAYDEDRRVFLEENIRDLCTGTDSRLANLRRRYADNPDVIAALAQYEERIEAVEPR